MRAAPSGSQHPPAESGVLQPRALPPSKVWDTAPEIQIHAPGTRCLIPVTLCRESLSALRSWHQAEPTGSGIQTQFHG
ncbi:hypothetical protein EYF80_015234 [Liparis tanakae]|uniref:Uncharacterized protein n=1 Tax=Liparis tanakae TaxID=230148 RepID=A0A4Z2IAW9_9TELE|nr:hypothetical protein EYF80_015234 [Liparis tanakae]